MARADTPKGATDDLPHRRELIRPWLQASCVPPEVIVKGDDDLGHDRVKLALDTYDGKLVACAQMETRRGGTVFGEDVSYACWDVDAKTGKLARRSDLARSYFRCEDGTCPPADGVADAVSYDGKEIATWDAGSAAITVYARGSDGARGAKLRTLAVPSAIDRGALGGIGTELIDMPGAMLIVDDNRNLHELDARGREVATAQATTAAHVVDDDHVLAMADDLHGVSIDLARHAATTIALPGCTDDELIGHDRGGPCESVLAATHVIGSVRYGGALYAIDDAGRRLLRLDPKTYRATDNRALAVCAPP